MAAARAEPEDVGRLERLVTEVDAAGAQEPPDFEVVGDRDTQFHLGIAGCAENRVLLRIMQAIQDLHREQLETSQRECPRPWATIVGSSRRSARGTL